MGGFGNEMNTIIKTDKQNRSAALKNFLKTVLEKELLHAIVLPIELNGNLTVALVHDSSVLENAELLSPFMTVNSARLVSNLTKNAAPSGGKKIAVLVRPCEERALLELVKLKQASLENLVLIGIDCAGTYPPKKYEEKATENLMLREACTVCEYPESLNADIILGLAGIDDDGMLLCSRTELGDSLLKEAAIDVAPDELENKRQNALSNLKTERLAEKEKLFAKYREKLNGLENLREIFASCINCQNCREVCPVCYCRECFFDSPLFEWNADNYIAHADKLGALALPSDRLLFHLTRLNHMSASCVGCGLCEEACPMGIPVFSIFRLSGDRVQAAFDYVAGRDLNEPLPVTEFRENELEHIGN